MQRADTIILGGGLVGLTLALALDRHGVGSIVVDPADPEKTLAPQYDGRATAISSTSWHMLQAIGVGERLEGQGCPIRSIKVSEGLKPGGIAFDSPDAEDPLGIMFENRLLRGALRAAALEAPNVTLLMPARADKVVRDDFVARVTLSDGEELAAPLLVGAEGRNSPMREQAGIAVARWNYRHVAIIATITHARPHGNAAYELFYPAGPFAILPMLPGNRSAIVWSVPEKDAPAILDLPDRALVAEIQKRMGDFLGPIALAGPRASYKLGFHHAATITSQRLALVGDAAHGIHPIAGQGLNLGLKDVAALAECIADSVALGLDPGDVAGLERYQRWRRFDNVAMALATDFFDRLFSNDLAPIRVARRLGLGAVNAAGPARRFFMRYAGGAAGDLPKLLRGESLAA